MSSTTGEHINELEERRRRRQAAECGSTRTGETAPQREHRPRSAGPAARPDHEWIAARRSGRGPSTRRKCQSDGRQRERFRRDGGQTPTGGSSKRRRGRRARSARASRRADRGRRGRTHDSAAPPYRHRRPFGRRGNPEPSAMASRPPCRRSHFARGRVQAAGRLGGRDCHRPNRGRRPCAVVGLRGRTRSGHDPKRAKPGDGGRSRVRHADNDRQRSTASSRR